MIVFTDKNVSGIICSSILQSLSTQHNKTLINKTHNGSIETINSYVIEHYIAGKSHCWIIGTSIDFTFLRKIKELVNSNPEVKFMVVSSKQVNDTSVFEKFKIILKHNKIKFFVPNIAHYSSEFKHEYEILIDFFKEKKYLNDLHKYELLKYKLKDPKSKNYLRISCLLEHINYCELKEELIGAELYSGTEKYADFLINEEKKIIKEKIKNGIIQIENDIVLCVENISIQRLHSYLSKRFYILCDTNSKRLEIYDYEDNVNILVNEAKLYDFLRSDITDKFYDYCYVFVFREITSLFTGAEYIYNIAKGR